MKYHIKFKTPGSILSSDTLFTVLSVLRKDFENGIIEAFIQEFPQLSKRKVAEEVKGKISFNFQEVKRGSWIIDMDGALVLLIGKILFELGKDVLLKHPEWEKFKEVIYRITRRAAKNTKEKIEKHEEIGPFNVEQNDTQIQEQNDGISKLDIEIDFSRKNNTNVASTAQEQEEILKSEFEKKKDKDDVH